MGHVHSSTRCRDSVINVTNIYQCCTEQHVFLYSQSTETTQLHRQERYIKIRKLDSIYSKLHFADLHSTTDVRCCTCTVSHLHTTTVHNQHLIALLLYRGSQAHHPHDGATCYSCMEGILGGGSTSPFTTTPPHRTGCFCAAAEDCGGDVAAEGVKLDTTSSNDCRNTTDAAPPADHPTLPELAHAHEDRAGEIRTHNTTYEQLSGNGSNTRQQ